MKTLRILLSTALLAAGTVAVAQDFSDPKYAKWGDTPEAREKNMIASNYLKEEYKMKDYNRAAFYLNQVLTNCPKATMSAYQYGANIYKKKIDQADTDEQKKVLIDSLLWIYDLRLEHFGDHPKRGAAYILDRKAREVLTYMPENREAVRKAFKEAIEAGQENSDPETIVAYFSNLCDDYKNDMVVPDEIIAEYDRLTLLFGTGDENAEFKQQFDAAFGLSGAASCENLEKLYRSRLAENPDNEELLSQAVKLMSRAKCESDYYFELAEKYYEIKPSSENAMFLAQAFQNKGDYSRAVKYLDEAMATETDPAELEKLNVRIALVELVANHIPGAFAAARKAVELNSENGLAYFVMAQCHAVSAGQCGGFEGQAAFWAAYDTMSKAVKYLEGQDADYLEQAKQSLTAYSYRFPTKEECFMRDMAAGSSYKVQCGTAAGVITTVRPR